MINSLPIIGWFLSAFFNISLAIPFWFCWTYWQLGTKYFTFLPAQWQSIPFWQCVGLFIVISIAKGVLVPRLAVIEQTNKSEKP